MRESVYLDILPSVQTPFQGETSQNLYLWMNTSQAGWPLSSSMLVSHPHIPLIPTQLSIQLLREFVKYILTAQLKSSRKNRKKAHETTFCSKVAFCLLMVEDTRPMAGHTFDSRSGPKTASLSFSDSRIPSLSSSKKTTGWQWPIEVGEANYAAKGHRIWNEETIQVSVMSLTNSKLSHISEPIPALSWVPVQDLPLADDRQLTQSHALFLEQLHPKTWG